jgi:branched-chain amino acid transport system permease protein
MRLGLRAIAHRAGAFQRQLDVTAYVRLGLLIVGLIGVIALPAYGPTYVLTLMTTVLIYAIFAMSLDLLLGYTGLASFGHAAFFGLGAYAASIASIHWSASLWTSFGVALLVSAAGALVIGYLSIRAGGVYFLMLTLALSQLLYAMSTRMDVIGGSNGLPGVPRPTLAPLPNVIDLSDRTTFFYAVAAVFTVSLILLRGVVVSPFGRSLVGIRENEARMRALGYSTQWHKLAAFVISGVLGGVAGAFFAYQKGFTSPDLFSWALSGVVLVMVIMGGSGTLIGPVIGALVYVFFQDIVSSVTGRWQLVFGASFILFILVARNGIVGVVRTIAARAPWLQKPP